MGKRKTAYEVAQERLPATRAALEKATDRREGAFNRYEETRADEMRLQDDVRKLESIADTALPINVIDRDANGNLWQPAVEESPAT